MDIAREWLQMELGDLYVEEEWEELETRSERQLNMSDCGVFTCMNALAAATGRGFSELRITSGMRDARKYMTAVILNGGFKGEFAL
jgi:Ulp1 family protease